MAARSPRWWPGLGELTPGTMRMVTVGGHPVALVTTERGTFALDNACPHQGYGLVTGTLAGDTVTCQWHNWKFDVATGRCLLGEEDVACHPVTVADGEVRVTVRRPTPAETRGAGVAQPAPGPGRRLHGAGGPRHGAPARRRRHPGRHHGRHGGRSGRPHRWRGGPRDGHGRRLPGLRPNAADGDDRVLPAGARACRVGPRRPVPGRP